MSVLTPRPIDPLHGGGHDRYDDDLVTVERRGEPAPHAAHTRHFATWREDDRLHVVHRLRPDQIDNDLAGLVSDELFDPGWLTGGDVFERVFSGIVLSSAADATSAWELFYRNTLERLRHPGATGSLAEYAPVYAHALSLVPSGTVLELGCCFGFLSLQLAEQARVTASDVTPNTVRLLGQVARRLDVGLDTLICDAARVPRPDASYDTVLAVHLLEHLEESHAELVVAEMLRLARHRVVVAVPFEDEPSAAYGHLRCFDLDVLNALGRASGWRYRTYEHHGGWLVLER